MSAGPDLPLSLLCGEGLTRARPAAHRGVYPPVHVQAEALSWLRDLPCRSGSSVPRGDLVYSGCLISVSWSRLRGKGWGLRPLPA